MDQVKKKNLIIIAPKGPAEVCGVSDQAYLTAQSLLEYYTTVKIGVAELPLDSSKNTKGFDIKLWQQLVNEANKSSEASVIMLNYTPLSYAFSGLPLRLIRSLRNFKSSNPENKVFVFIHEAWSDDPNLKIHHAIRNKFVKWSSVQIDKIADGIAVVTEEQKLRAEKLLKNNTISLNPVGANIFPENKEAGLYSKRNAGEWLIFGLAHTRLWTIEAHLSTIKRAYEAGTLKKLIALGPNDNAYAKKEFAIINEKLGPNILIQLGAIESDEVSNVMLSVEAALVGQNPVSLKKSSTFMALASHGVPVICEVPETAVDPPGGGFFSSKELTNTPFILSSEEGARKRELLYNWFWSTRSWDAIGVKIDAWLNKENQI